MRAASETISGAPRLEQRLRGELAREPRPELARGRQPVAGREVVEPVAAHRERAPLERLRPAGHLEPGEVHVREAHPEPREQAVAQRRRGRDRGALQDVGVERCPLAPRARRERPVALRERARGAPEHEAAGLLELHHAPVVPNPPLEAGAAVGREAPRAHRARPGRAPAPGAGVTHRAVGHRESDSACTVKRASRGASESGSKVASG
jgi:hypothetical protein